MKNALTSGERKFFFAALQILIVIVGSWWWHRPAPEPIPKLIELPSRSLGSGLSFSPDSKRLVAFFKDSNNKTVEGRIYDVKTHALIRHLDVPSSWNFKSSIGIPAWSADGKRIVAISSLSPLTGFTIVRSISIWDATSGALKSNYTYSPADSKLIWREIRFSSDGKTLIGGGIPPTIYNAATGKRLNKPDLSVVQYPMSSQLNEKGDLLAQYEPNSKGYFRVVDARTKRVLWQPNIGNVKKFRWQGDVLCVQSVSGWFEGVRQGEDRLWLWDGKTRQELSSPPTILGADIFDFSFNPNGKTIAYVDSKEVKNWFSTEIEGEIVAYDYRANRDVWRRTETRERLAALDWSPDGKRLVALVGDNFYSPHRVFGINGVEQFRDNISHTFIYNWSPDSRNWASFAIINANSASQIHGIEIQRFED